MDKKTCTENMIYTYCSQGMQISKTKIEKYKPVKVQEMNRKVQSCELYILLTMRA